MTATDRATNVSTATFTVIRDTTPPQVWLEVPRRVTTATIPLTWGAEDTQSGIARYDVQVSVEDGDWTDWLTGTLETEATYVAEEGEWFAFRVIATDNVSNAGSAEATSSLVRVTKYYYHGGQRVAMRQVGPESGSVVYYLHGDHLGSTSLTTDASGAVVARQLYHPYGTVRAHQGTLPTDYQYTGQRAEDFGLYDYHARYYDGAIGRFISADTIVPQAGNPQDFNRYSYVRNSPLNYRDPSGHAATVDQEGDITVRPLGDGKFMLLEHPAITERSEWLLANWTLTHDPKYYEAAGREAPPATGRPWVDSVQLAEIYADHDSAIAKMGSWPLFYQGADWEWLMGNGGGGVLAEVYRQHPELFWMGMTAAGMVVGDAVAGEMWGAPTVRNGPYRTYVVRSDNNNVRYVGRTRRPLRVREGEHRRTPGRENWRLVLDVDGMSRDQAIGREQILYETYYGTGLLENIRRPLGPRNPRHDIIYAAGSSVTP